MKTPRDNDQTASLRKRAEEKLAKQRKRLGELVTPDLQKLLHELDTHQIELEMQNEELRRAQTALEASHRKYADLYDYSPVGYFTLDRNGLIEQVNHTGAGMLGLGKGQLVGWPIRNLIAPADTATFRAHLAEVFSTGSRQTCEISLIREDGRLLPVQLVSSVAMGGEEAPPSCHTAVSDITERKRIEAALRDNELQASALINSADESIMLFSLAGEFLAANITAARRLGLSVEEVVGKNCRDLLPPALAAARIAKVEEIVRTGAPGSFEDERAGIIFEHTAYPVRDVSGAVTAVAVFSRDITERRQAELAREQLTKELHQLATELDTVFAALPVLVSLHDREGRHLRVNPAVKALFGIDPTQADRAEIAGRLRARFPDGRPLTVESMPSSRVLQGETVSGVEYLLDDGQGREHVMLFNAVPLRTEEGQVSGMVLAQMDITERIAAEKGWRQSQLDMARAQQVGQIGIWRLDVRRNVLTWSAENHRIFGIPEGTPLTYETFLAAVHPDDRAYVDTSWQAALAGEPYDLEHRLLVAGQVVWVREKAFLEFGADGSLLGGFGITQDISERKQAEAAIRRLNERLGQKVSELEAVNKELQGFTYSVSHDLRAPIRHIAGFAQLLEKKLGLALTAEGREFLTYITSAAEKLGVLVDELLEFSRMGRAEIGRGEVDLGPLFRQVVENLRQKTMSRQIDWRVGELPVVHGDATMLRFAVENLIGNAVKFTSTRPQARIEIGRIADEKKDIVFVKDNGGWLRHGLL